MLLQRFDAEVRDLRFALNDEAIRAEAAQVIAQLFESVAIHPDGQGPEAEITARVEVLIGYAANDDSPGPVGLGLFVLR